MATRLIMISGFKNAGKDTTAKLLSQKFIYDFNSIEYYALARPIKEIASILFNIPFEVLDGKTPENRTLRETIDQFWEPYIPDFTPRKSLTMLGTDVLRQYIHDDIWILKAQKYILDSSSNTVVITDLREPNEEVKLERFCEDNDISCIHINIERERPSWFNIAKKAYFDNDQHSIDNLETLGIHPSEWKQVGLTPDIVIYNQQNDYVNHLCDQLDANKELIIK